MKKGKINTSLILSALALSIPMGNSFAQYNEDPLLTESADAVVNTSQIDIEGMYNTQNQNSNKKKVTEADRLQQFRRDLEEKHEQMMRKKVEDMRLEEERKLARKLQEALSGQMNAMDQVTTKASAPVQTEAVAPVVSEVEYKNSISLGGGFLNIASEKNELEASMNIRLGMESLVHPRVAVGVGVRYMSFDTADVDNIYASNLYNGNSYIYPYANNNYNNNEARNIQYRQISFDVNTKIFLTVDSKIRPFVGGSLAYNRGSYKYEKNDKYTIGQYSYGDEKVSNNNVSGLAMLGAQVKFTNQIAAEINVSFEKAFTSGVSELSNDDTPDEARLRNLALDLEDANVVAINLGLSVSF